MKKIFISGMMLLNAVTSFAKSDTTSYVDEIMVFKVDGSDIFARYIKAEPCNQEENSTLAIIIAGSGPTDANGNNPFLKSYTYKYLAEELGRHGISSVRYDKRGIGNSQKAGPKESDLRFDMYVNDANTIVNAMTNYKRIIIIGHSEGSLIGMMVAARNPYVSKFISIAGPGRSADLVLKEQFKDQPEEVNTMAVPMIDSLKAGLTVTNVPPFLKSVFRKSVQGYMMSWFKYDPQIEIKKVKVPILIIQGTKDLQVQVLDAQQLYLANTTATLKVIDNMNHVMRIIESEEKSENFKAYNNPRLPLSGELLKLVVEFSK
ncbi:MAG: lysophospholipase [Sphingobacteriales bacterium]|nr:lysophospholipase [Sphingobacteriales bacterium]